MNSTRHLLKKGFKKARVGFTVNRGDIVYSVIKGGNKPTFGINPSQNTFRVRPNEHYDYFVKK